jgi:serine O-acetyltransferase
MIQSKEDYKYYVACDLKAHQLTSVSCYDYWWRDCLRFQLRLRKIEYLHNVKRNNPFCRLRLFFLEIANHWLATRLGLSIPKNVFGPGLCIVHYGTIVVSPFAKVGAWCRIHPSTSIGEYNGTPRLGDYVYIGPGAKLFGNITVGDNVAIGANAVVNKSFGSNLSVAGVPAQVLSDKGAKESGVYPSSVFIENNN